MKSWYSRSGNKKRKIIVSILISVIIGITILGVVLFKKENMDVWLNARSIKALESEKVYYATKIYESGRLSNSIAFCFTIKDDGTMIILSYFPQKITKENQNEFFWDSSYVISYVKARYEKNSLNYDLPESETEMVDLIFWDYEEVKEHRPCKIRKKNIGEYKEDMIDIPSKICRDEQGWKFIWHKENWGQYKIEYLISEGKNEKLPESVDEFLADYQ